MDMCLSYNETCGLNLDVIQSKAMPATCYDFLIDVKYLGKTQKCDDIFRIEHTNSGICYTTSGLKRHLTYTRATQEKIQLTFEYREPEGFGMDVSMFS